jgi:hypothetical protein
LPEDACCYGIELYWGGVYGSTFELEGYLHDGKFHFQGFDRYSFSGAYDMDAEVYSLTKTSDDAYVFFGVDMSFTDTMCESPTPM